MGWASRLIKPSSINYILYIRPWSPLAFGVALAAMGLGTGLRMLFGVLGTTLYFAPYFPFVLLVSVFVGAPAGVVMCLLTVVVVWFLFVPPVGEFGPLSQTEYVNFALFLLAGLLIVWLSQLYRTSLEKLLKADATRELLIKELNHRAGNLLAVVQAIIQGTVVQDKATAHRLSGRVGALAKANAAVIANSLGERVSLGKIISNETKPYADGERVRLEGPEVLLNAECARNLALVVHELTTNAAKYGAFSEARGSLHLRWSEARGRCTLFWREMDGPAVVTPERMGFGSRMMQASMQTIQGTIEPDFCSDGYRCTLTFSILSGEN